MTLTINGISADDRMGLIDHVAARRMGTDSRPVHGLGGTGCEMLVQQLIEASGASTSSIDYPAALAEVC